ncbi:hypothetical protein GCM10010168_61320 [Actinoplanes ianthinogenes]|uniref:TetR family transcriptional regulator n=1 Tax=Actinoplanes ianthinogenes TaxID=122358 RepID=A0ABM7M4I9_9ACTN|nr:hypothetical protein [Actinoplanes ianthinogenes]BCJ46493.1 hypothetical protein Aiant_71500 [Actinoplanes ianthinogenes]GGR34625.1 hypothetical protein GCM10010168_61320 [Actinoplanes ianthinogenes]
MEELTYGRAALLHAYVAADGGNGLGDYGSESESYDGALRAHHRAMLDGLQRLFAIELTFEGMPDQRARVLFMLFRSTAGSLNRLTTPWSGFLEAGLLHRHLDDTGDAGARVYEASHRIATRTDENRQDHLAILDDLLTVILGERAEARFTESDLRALGIDPQPPDVADFDDLDGY